MTGQAWRFGDTALPERRNAFEASLTGASAVRLSTGRMKLDVGRRLTGDVTTAGALRLTLEGPFGREPAATIDGRPAALTRSARLVTIAVPPGHHQLVLLPR